MMLYYLQYLVRSQAVRFFLCDHEPEGMNPLVALAERLAALVYQPVGLISLNLLTRDLIERKINRIGNYLVFLLAR